MASIENYRYDLKAMKQADYIYRLDKGSKKYICPNCDKKTFVRYINAETNEYIPEQYGRCDRESKCNYHLNPYTDGYVKMIWEQSQAVTKSVKVTHQTKHFSYTPPKPRTKPKVVFFDFDTFKKTLQAYDKNIFLQNLLLNVPFPFDVSDINKLIQLYRLGTIANGYRKGAITFPFIDVLDNVRAIQVKQFDKYNHTTGTDFLHSIIEKHQSRNNKPLPKWLQDYIQQDKRITCLFGEHLLNKYPKADVYLFEAPKTAIYSTLYFGFPEANNIISLAVYNKSSFSFDKLKALQGRFVYVFPDLSENGITFNEWKNKAEKYESQLSGTKFIFSDLLERLAPKQDKAKGLDFADYLIKQDWRNFRTIQKIEQIEQPKKEKRQSRTEAVTKVTKVTLQTKPFFSDNNQLPKAEVLKFEQEKRNKPENWNNEIREIEKYFDSIDMPKYPIKLNSYTTIKDCSTFVNSHLASVKANNGNSTFLPYLNRLQALKQVLIINTD